MRIIDYIGAVRSRWRLVISLCIVGVLVAGALFLATPIKYRAEARVFVSTGVSNNVVDLNTGSSFVQQAVKSYASLVTTPFVLDRVIKDLDLNVTPNSLGGTISATAPLDESVITIDAIDASPRMAASVANSAAANLSDAVEQLTQSDSGRDGLVKVTPVSLATPPISPVGYSGGQQLLIGAILGLLLGVVAAVGRSKLDTRIRSSEDLSSYVDGPLLGQTMLDRKSAEDPLTVGRSATDASAEAYRALQANLRFARLGSGTRKFVITSSLPGEGKSTLAVNLAAACVEAGQSTLLIDVDLRRPRAATYLGLDGSVGVTDVLTEQVLLKDAVQQWSLGEKVLSMLPAGAIPPNPAELVQSQEMERLLESFDDKYDIVLIDAPPVLAVPDAAVLARIANGAIFIASADSSRRAQVQAGLAKLRGVDARVFGFVLTKVKRNKTSKYAYSYYGYSALPAE